MYPRISCELATDSLRSAEHTLGTADVEEASKSTSDNEKCSGKSRNLQRSAPTVVLKSP